METYSWEFDQIAQPYNPIAECLKKEIPLKPKSGLSKSEKQEFKKHEYERRTKLIQFREMESSKISKPQTHLDNSKMCKSTNETN